MYLPDGKRFVEFRGETVFPDSNLFSTKEMHLHASRSDGVTLQKLDVAIEGKKSKIVAEKQGQSSTVEGEWADNTVVDLAMFYLVTLLPHEANRQYRIENFAASSSLRQPKPHILECSGPDPQAAPAEKTWTLFLLYEPNNRADAVRYWVSEDGLLRRVQLNTQNRLDLISDRRYETPRSSKSRIGKMHICDPEQTTFGNHSENSPDYGCLSSVTVHGVAVILIAAKNLTWLRGIDEIPLRSE